jgi:hypothetical protein
MATERLDGKPQTARQWRVEKPCPLPTPADRGFCLCTSLQTYALQVVQGRLWGLAQRKAPPWMPVLVPAVLMARRTLGKAPARSLTALAPQRGTAEATAARRYALRCQRRQP